MIHENIIVQRFNSAEEAYLFGLGQAMANAVNMKTTSTFEMNHQKEIINNIRAMANDVLKSKATSININKSE